MDAEDRREMHKSEKSAEEVRPDARSALAAEPGDPFCGRSPHRSLGYTPADPINKYPHS